MAINTIENDRGWHFGEDGEPVFDDHQLDDDLWRGKATNILSREPRNPIEGVGINPNPIEPGSMPIQIQPGVVVSPSSEATQA